MVLGLRNKFHVFVRVVISSEDNATSFVRICGPYKPEFMICNRTKTDIWIRKVLRMMISSEE